MSDNTNPQAVRFANEKLRPACDAFVSAIRTLRQLRADYVAQGVGPLVAGSAELQQAILVDGSAGDGRTPLSGYDVDLASGAAQAVLDWVDGAGVAHVAALTKPSVNTQPRF